MACLYGLKTKVILLSVLKRFGLNNKNNYSTLHRVLMSNQFTFVSFISKVKQDVLQTHPMSMESSLDSDLSCWLLLETSCCWVLFVVTSETVFGSDFFEVYERPKITNKKLLIQYIDQ